MPKKLFVHGFGSSSCTGEFGGVVKSSDARFDWKPDKSLTKTVDELAQKIKKEGITHIVSASFGAVLGTMALQKIENKTIQHLSFYPVHNWRCIENTFFEKTKSAGKNTEYSPVDLVTKKPLETDPNGNFVFGKDWKNLIVHPSFYSDLKDLELSEYQIRANKVVYGKNENLLDYTRFRNEISNKILRVFDIKGKHDFTTFIPKNQKLAESFGGSKPEHFANLKY